MTHITTPEPEALGPSIPVFKRAAIWLAFLAPFFYLSYGTANWLAAQRDEVPNLAFEWEESLPFLAWTILPYWSINIFYGLSLFINRTVEAVDRLARRYLTVQVIAVLCFIAFPLTAIFVRPETDGLPGLMFDVLGGFDKPFNQAPSLHVALLVVIWDHLRHKLDTAPRLAWHVWCLLIGASVLTTYQHQIIDIPTGALLGLFALWLFPAETRSPLAGFRFASNAKARKLGLYYALGAALLVIGAIVWTASSGLGLLLLWPALSLAIVAVGYFGAGPAIFQKSEDGRVTIASRLLLLPYRLGAWINVWAWTRKLPASNEIADGVFLGRFPRRREISAFSSVVDLTGEFIPIPSDGLQWHAFPLLDLVSGSTRTLEEAADAIEAARQQGPVLVCCALGFQRSVAATTLWLIRSGRAADTVAAFYILKANNRRLRLTSDVIPVIARRKA